MVKLPLTASIRLVQDFKAANLSHANNLIKGSSNTLTLNPALIYGYNTELKIMYNDCNNLNKLHNSVITYVICYVTFYYGRNI